MQLSGRILLAGDWHGSFSQADKAIRHAKSEGIQTIIHLGDFGIWKNDKPYLNRMQALLEVWDITLYFIDGNHENFPMLYEKRILDNGTRFVRDNIFHLPRGFRIQWENLSILCLGGAASIDRLRRREGVSWWSGEYITDDDVQRATEGGYADIMLCHDSPATAPNTCTDDIYGQIQARKFFGAEVLDECNAHREQLQRVTDVVTPRILVHGHYHEYMSGFYRHKDANQTTGYVLGLDQGTASLAKSTAVLTIEEIKSIIEQLDNIQSSDIVEG